MKIGIDFDNTIVNYDFAFFSAALKLQLITGNTAKTKSAVKTAIIQNHTESQWTELQGIVYGKDIATACPYPYVIDFIDLASTNHEIFIVSHRSKYPYLGEQIDLHRAAHQWINSDNFKLKRKFNQDHVFFNTSLEKKIAKIAELKCDVFVDDLLSVLTNPAFPKDTKKIWFHPNSVPSNTQQQNSISTLCHWQFADKIIAADGR